MCNDCYNIFPYCVPKDVTDVEIRISNGKIRFYPSANHPLASPFLLCWKPGEFINFYHHFIHASTDPRLKLEAQSIYNLKVLALSNHKQTRENIRRGVSAARAVFKADKNFAAKAKRPHQDAPLDEELAGHFAQQVAAAKKLSAAKASKQPSTEAASLNKSTSQVSASSNFLLILKKEEKHVSHLPGDFPWFKHLLVEKNHVSYLPCDFYKSREMFSERGTEAFLPSDFYKFKNMFCERSISNFLPSDFYKFKNMFSERSTKVFMPSDFFKFKDMFTERSTTVFLPCDFFKFKDSLRETYPDSFLPGAFHSYKHLVNGEQQEIFFPTDFEFFGFEEETFTMALEKLVVSRVPRNSNRSSKDRKSQKSKKRTSTKLSRRHRLLSFLRLSSINFH